MRFFESVKTVLVAVFKWMIDPVKLMEAAQSCLGYLMWAVGWLMSQVDPNIGAVFMSFGDKVSEAPIAKLYGIALYMTSPVVPPSIMQACTAIVVETWLVCLVVKMFMVVKGFIYPSGN